MNVMIWTFMMTTLLLCASLQDQGLSWSEALPPGENLYREPRRRPEAGWHLERVHGGSGVTSCALIGWQPAILAPDWLTQSTLTLTQTDAGILQIFLKPYFHGSIFKTLNVLFHIAFLHYNIFEIVLPQIKPVF